MGALWGKSANRGGGRRNLLVQHLLDTAAVAELIWDRYLAESACDRITALTGDRVSARRFFAWLCGIHDWGKATPAFQHLDPEGAEQVRQAGLGWDPFVVSRYRWRHERAGAVVAIELLAEFGWCEEQLEWVWPLIAGHHGVFPSKGELKPPGRSERELRGSSEWIRAQRAVVEWYTAALGFGSVADVVVSVVPDRALQLQLSGLVVMADWIASDETHFPGIDDLGRAGIEEARKRAARAWAELGLRRGWGRIVEPSMEDFERRFGEAPRQSQRVTLECAARMPCPGLLVVQAPTGEGKTKAALMAAEVLAARFGMDGVFVGMPTQATCDPMFSTVRRWLSELGDDLPAQVALLHGKRRFNAEWQRMLGAQQALDARYRSVAEDESGFAHPRGAGGCSDCETDRLQRHAPAEWTFGRNRGLLAPFAVGTMDQLLIAATRTRHVMLRMAGLAGKVVVLDEVHATDVYMSQFLVEGLRWLAQAGVPVVLLSATLSPQQHQDLVEAYLTGARGAEQAGEYRMPQVSGYPRITSAWYDGANAHVEMAAARPWRSGDLEVAVETLSEGEGADAALVDLLRRRLDDGGCVLVVRNTVARAQQTYQRLRGVFGMDVRLLHGRMHVRHRADRTAEFLRVLGPPSAGRSRPARLILVATQIAEQSFDVDVDLLITDLAPMDLLLQRIGRMHRHAGTDRPPLLRRPTVVVTGWSPQRGTSPRFPAASEKIYGRWPLIMAAHAVERAAATSWAIPSAVPALVSTAYDPATPVNPEWAVDAEAALQAWLTDCRGRAEAARRFLLTRFGEHARTTLAGLHRLGGQDAPDDQVFVRDGDKTVEVVLVRSDGQGYRTMTGRLLGSAGEASPELVEDLLGGTVRLPASLTANALAELEPLDGWRDHPWLRYSRALVLNEADTAVIGQRSVRYDDELGLVVEGPARVG
ncbi:CRISPR-associated helicase Cas3' [Nocardia farcinica]|nr:CRISPR-associated helicase Cas3' [Nocardia farcinica]MBF6284545.1 CRISPR-associated helicase Cas3' [Nocardia farcinica]MBF6309007.1 CRISPR-associated helicase Cas3' [Nocardia farcinica]MBF6392999.1 CRISPR-associated helicase Cas3' [Nocardia farcinica]MBF6527606.1 CRISPR-associated helicase Cas3' [Nocardia farcinica]